MAEEKRPRPLEFIRARMKRVGAAWVVFGVGMSAVMVSLVLAHVPPTNRVFRAFERAAEDLAFRLRPAPASSDRIAHIDIDDQSVEQIDSWPFRRIRHAQLLRALDRLDAAVVVFDVEFDRPSHREDDEALAKAIARSGRVVLACHFKQHADKMIEEFGAFDRLVEALRENPVAEEHELAGRCGVPVEQLRGRTEQLRRLAMARLVAAARGKTYAAVRWEVAPHVTEGDHPWLERMIHDLYDQRRAIDHVLRQAPSARDLDLPAWSTMVVPIESLASGTAGFGFTNGIYDEDGSARRVDPVARFEDRLALHYGASAAEVWRRKSGVAGAAGEAPPLGDRTSVLLDWVPDTPARVVPYARVIEYWDRRFQKETEAFTQLAAADPEIGKERFREIAARAESEREAEEEFFRLRGTMADRLRESVGALRERSVDPQVPEDEKKTLHERLSGFDSLLRFQRDTDKLEKELRSKLEGKICFVGAAGTATGDLHPTPLGAMVPGVRVGSTLCEMLIAGRTLTRLPRWIDFFAALLLGAGVSAAGARWTPWAASVAAAGLAAAWLGGAYVSFASLRHLVSFSGPPATAMVAFFAVVTYRVSSELRFRRKIQRVLEGRTSPVLVREILEDPEPFRTPRKMNVTIFFSDIERFTAHSEAMPPDKLVAYLNRHHQLLSGILLSSHAYLDKFIGDGIMAVFGVVGERPKHALRACSAALLCQKALTGLNTALRADGLPEIATRIGINTGEVVAGFIGSEDRSDYTVVGDEVNLAARIEGANKEYGTSILVSEMTALTVSDTIEIREIDVVRVHGRTRPVRLYEPLAKGGYETEFMDLYRSGLEAYRSRRFMEAMKRFERALTIRSDGPSRVYIRRARTFAMNPPQEDWDGVHDLVLK